MIRTRCESAVPIEISLLELNEKVCDKAIELVGMFPLGPVPTSTKDVQLRIFQTPDKPQPQIKWKKTIITPPNHKRWRIDFTQTVAHVGELLGI